MALLATLAGGVAPGPPAGASPRAPAAGELAQSGGQDRRPSVVLVLMDDFSMDLLRLMPQARAMARQGATYRRAFAVDSLCCPSRASLLTGLLPHQSGVVANVPRRAAQPMGGFKGFVDNGNLPKQVAVPLQASGYTTGYVGKFLNGYGPGVEDVTADPPPVVPGWTEWDAVLRGGYNGWGFLRSHLDDSGQMQLIDHPAPDRALPDAEIDRRYATNVISDLATDFVRRHEVDGAPYFLQVAPYGPHSQLQRAYPDSPTYPSALADRAREGRPASGNCGLLDCRELAVTDLAGYADPRRDNRPTYLLADGSTRRAPAWRTNEVRLPRARALTLYRDRARMVASIDRMVERLRAEAGPNTYVVLTSDNGLHLGQHRLDVGKGTPYDSDLHVPLLITGPGVVPGPRRQLVSGIDIAPTIEDLAGLRSPAYRSGRSIAGPFADPDRPGARFVYAEHTHLEPRFGEVNAGVTSYDTTERVPSWTAIRGAGRLLARFDLDLRPRVTRYAYELYRYDVPWERRNVFDEQHRRPAVRDLVRRLDRLEDCAARACRSLLR